MKWYVDNYKKICRHILLILLFLGHSALFAQNEVARERSSLKGINAMGFTVNLEANASLKQKGEIEVNTLREMGIKTLRNGGISLISDKEMQRSDEIPFLFLHVNSMNAGQGLVPFSLSLYFYQPVKLTLNRDLRSSAITWESGSVGIVSYDQIDLISDAAKNLIEEFISDYNQINSSN